MKTSSKKPLIISALTALAFAGAGAGATFALFTSQSEATINATAGKVNLQVTPTLVATYSAQGNPQGNVTDENGAKYELVDQTLGQFANGGDAAFAGGALTINKLTPGDGVRLQIATNNASNVKAKYRLVIQGDNDDISLLRGLTLHVENQTLQMDETYEGIYRSISQWTELASEEQIGTFDIDLYLPITAGNEYQSLEGHITFGIEAVQANAVTSDEEAGTLEIKGLTVAADLSGISHQEGYYVVDEDFAVASNEGYATVDNGNTILDLAGHTISSSASCIATVTDGATLTLVNSGTGGEFVSEVTGSNSRAFNATNGGTLILDGADVTRDSDLGIFAMDGGNVVLNSGSLSSNGGYAGVYARNGCNVEVNDVEISGYTNAVGAFDVNTDIVVNGGDIHDCTYGVGQYHNGDIVFNGGNITASGYAFFTNGGDSLDTNIYVNGGTFVSTGNTAVYAAGCKNFYMHGGSITGTRTAIAMRAGAFHMDGGSLNTTYAGEKINLAHDSGIALSLYQHSTMQDLCADITGGSFNAKCAVAVTNPLNNDVWLKDPATVTAASEGSLYDPAVAGTFTVAMSGITLNDGCLPLLNLDARYTVTLSDALAALLPANFTAERDSGDVALTLGAGYLYSEVVNP